MSEKELSKRALREVLWNLDIFLAVFGAETVAMEIYDLLGDLGW